MNDATILDSTSYMTGFIESGTTFTYLPKKLWKDIDSYFEEFCAKSEAHCAGKPTGRNICFEYSEDRFPKGPLEYFKTYPVLTFMLDAGTGKEPVEFNWFPSEYLYRHNLDTYCIAAEPYYKSNQILMGGTFMRQHNFIFDIDNMKLGLQHSQCHPDRNQIMSPYHIEDSGYLVVDDSNRNYTNKFTMDFSLMPTEVPEFRGTKRRIVEDKSETTMIGVFVALGILAAILVVIGCLYYRCWRKKKQTEALFDNAPVVYPEHATTYEREDNEKPVFNRNQTLKQNQMV